MATVEILLATFNSEQFIAAQLDSLLAQDYRDISVTIRDDGSTDGTWEILSGYTSRDPRVRLLPDRTSSGSAKSNFFRLLLESSADYVMTCDADDFWLPEKVSHTLAAMKKLENGDTDVPCLICSIVTPVQHTISTVLFIIDGRLLSVKQISSALMLSIFRW